MGENDLLSAIQRVIAKRKRRGAPRESITLYKRHLVDNVWKNAPDPGRCIILIMG